MNDILNAEQLRLLNLSKRLIKFEKKKDVNYFYYDENYLTSWAKNLGNIRLKNKNKKISLFFFYFYFFIKLLKNFIAYKDKYQLKFNFNKNIEIRNIIFSYSNNFNLQSNYIDPFFSTKISETKKSIWIILNIGKEFTIDNNFNFNVILIQKITRSNWKKLLLIPYGFFVVLFYLIISKKSYDNNLFNAIEESVKACLLKYKKITRLYIPFESQPHQNYLINFIKKLKPKIKVFGYLHSCLPPLPTEFFCNNLLDKIVVHGSEQSRILKKYLSWKQSDIILVPSFRYIVSKVKKNSIYLPYSFEDSKTILKNLRYIFEKKIISNFNLKVINHPHRIDSSSHIRIIFQINKMIKFFQSQNQNKVKILKKRFDSYSIFIGASASIIEAMEKGIKVLHISSDPAFEFHSNIIWNNILIKDINCNVRSYKLLKRGKIIKFGENKGFINKFYV